MTDTEQILVFGGNRFLGREVLLQARERWPEAQVWALTRSGVSSVDSVTNLRCDRRNRDALREILTDMSFDVVIDASAYQIDDLQPALDELKGRVGHWVMVSSAGVYAASQVFPLRADFPKIRTMPHLGKLECEEALRQQREFSVASLRPCYIYGPENTFDREAFSFRAIEAGVPVLVPAQNALLQFAHVRDVANSLLQLAETKAEGTFHVGDSSLYTARGLIEVIGRAMGMSPEIVTFSAEDCLRAQVKAREVFPWRDSHYFCDLAGSPPCRISMENGLRETYEWFCANRSRFPDHTLTEAGRKISSLKRL